jgi:cytidylate kinase
MTVITISRESGSEGNQVVKLVCDRLGWQFFDKHLMAQLAAEGGLDPSQVEDITADDHYVKSFWEEAFSGLSLSYGAMPWILTEPYEAKEEMTVRQVSGFIHAAYRHGNVVIVGRGSQVILKNKPDVLHVRIISPLERRVQRWIERKHISHEAAKDIVKERDRKHIDFVKTFFDEDLTNTDLYDLIINTDKLSLDAAAELIIEAAKTL